MYDSFAAFCYSDVFLPFFENNTVCNRSPDPDEKTGSLSNHVYQKGHKMNFEEQFTDHWPFFEVLSGNKVSAMGKGRQGGKSIKSYFLLHQLKTFIRQSI